MKVTFSFKFSWYFVGILNLKVNLLFQMGATVL